MSPYTVRMSGHRSELGAKLVGAVSAGRLVIEAVPLRDRQDRDVAETPAGVWRGGYGGASRAHERSQTDPEGDARLLLVVLLNRRTAIVEGNGHRPVEQHATYSGTVSIPATLPAGKGS